MHTPEDMPAKSGRWVCTFASDIRPRDEILLNGVEWHVFGRDYPAAHEPTYRLLHGGGIETIAKTTRVAIWDPDGSVIERVESLSATASVLAAISACNRIACGYVEPK